MRERRDSEGRRKLAGVLRVRGDSLVMLTGSPKSRHCAALFEHPICMKRQHFALISVDTDYLKLSVLETTV